jgi:hypothetical protein
MGLKECWPIIDTLVGKVVVPFVLFFLGKKPLLEAVKTMDKYKEQRKRWIAKLEKDLKNKVIPQDFYDRAVYIIQNCYPPYITALAQIKDIFSKNNIERITSSNKYGIQPIVLVDLEKYSLLRNCGIDGGDYSRFEDGMVENGTVYEFTGHGTYFSEFKLDTAPYEGVCVRIA